MLQIATDNKTNEVLIRIIEPENEPKREEISTIFRFPIFKERKQSTGN